NETFFKGTYKLPPAHWFTFPHDKPQPAPNRIALSPAADQKRQTYSLQNFPLSRLRPEYFRVIKHE
ncbi:hypothetical protein, partial [Alistipes putredinis]|uniref:hypothetical protein n=1 Tax=Alistipes putredinis TaxID=28117 RepID=UPI003AF69696